MEETGMGYDCEVDMIRIAHDMDLLTTPYAFNPDEAKEMTKAGADTVVAHVGTTLSGTIGAKDVMRLDEAVASVAAMFGAVKTIDKNALVICHGHRGLLQLAASPLSGRAWPDRSPGARPPCHRVRRSC